MHSSKIESIHARQVMDAKFRPVVEVDVTLENGAVGRGAAPTGNSVGHDEAYVLRDNDPDVFCGLSVWKAVGNVNDILAPALKGMNACEQEKIDRRMIEMDGTEKKRRLGANAIYSISIAVAQAAAAARRESFCDYIASKPIRTLPLPTANSIIGGIYEDMRVAFQEYTFAPYKAESITEAMEIISTVHAKLGTYIAKYQHGVPAQRGNGHGWKPPFADPDAILGLLAETVEACGYTDKVAYVLDIAANETYDAKRDAYYINGDWLTADEQIAYVKRLTETYNFLFIEDILNEEDWEGFARASREIDRTILIGDDLIVTNAARLKKAHDMRAVEGFVFKPNQVGTITEAIEARHYAGENGMITVPSQRGGGTIWDIVVEMGIALEVEASKSCAPRGGESVHAMNSIYRAEDLYPQARMFDFTPLTRF